MIRKIGQSGELTRLFFYCFLGGAGEMVERKCDFDCKYTDDSGECEAVGSDCIGDLCEAGCAARIAPDQMIVKM